MYSTSAMPPPAGPLVAPAQAPAAYAPTPPVADRASLDNRRVKARLLDLGLIFLAYLLFIVYARDHGGWHPAYSWALLWLNVTYFFVCEAMFEQTLGKRQYGLHVVNAADGGTPNLNAIAARNIIRVVEEPVIALLVMVGSRKRRQRVGDLIAGTAVVEDDGLPGPGFEPMIGLYPALWGVLAALFVSFVLPPAEQSPASSGPPLGPSGKPIPTAPASSEYPPGAYPPAPSHAGPMTPEWEEFAGNVDRICAYNYNRALAVEDQIDSKYSGAVPRHKLNAMVQRTWSLSQQSTYAMAGTLGRPPERASLFGRWRENVAERGRLFGSMADASQRGEIGEADSIWAQITDLKADADRMGQRFGLQICTSNGASNN